MRPEPRSGVRRSPFSSIPWRSRPRAPGFVPRIQQDGYLFQLRLQSEQRQIV